MNNQKLVEALMQIQAAMDYCRERKAGGLKYTLAAIDSMRSAADAKDGQLSRGRIRMILSHLENAADELRRPLYSDEAREGPHGSAYDLLRVTHGWVGQIIKYEALSNVTVNVHCQVCNRRIGEGEFIYAHRTRGFSCSYCVAPDVRDDPSNCRECGAPFNNGNPSRSGKCPECEAGREAM